MESKWSISISLVRPLLVCICYMFLFWVWGSIRASENLQALKEAHQWRYYQFFLRPSYFLDSWEPGLNRYSRWSSQERFLNMPLREACLWLLICILTLFFFIIWYSFEANERIPLNQYKIINLVYFIIFYGIWICSISNDMLDLW